MLSKSRIALLLGWAVLACCCVLTAAAAPQDNWVMEPLRKFGEGDLEDMGSSFKVYNYCGIAADTNAFYLALYYTHNVRVFENAGSPRVINWVERTINFTAIASCWAKKSPTHAG